MSSYKKGQDDDMCDCDCTATKPLEYLGYGCTSEHVKQFFLSPRFWFFIVAVGAAETLLFLLLDDTR